MSMHTGHGHALPRCTTLGMTECSRPGSGAQINRVGASVKSLGSGVASRQNGRWAYHECALTPPPPGAVREPCCVGECVEDPSIPQARGVVTAYRRSCSASSSCSLSSLSVAADSTRKTVIWALDGNPGLLVVGWLHLPALAMPLRTLPSSLIPWRPSDAESLSMNWSRPTWPPSLPISCPSGTVVLHRRPQLHGIWLRQDGVRSTGGVSPSRCCRRS